MFRLCSSDMICIWHARHSVVGACHYWLPRTVLKPPLHPCTEHSRTCIYSEHAALMLIHNTGRPVDVQQLPDGSMLISDDSAGAVYRVAYRAPSGSTGGDAPAVTTQSGAAEQGNAAGQVPASGASSAGGGADVLNTALRLAVAALLAAAVALA